MCNGLQTFNGSLMDGRIALIILMIDKKLSINCCEQRVLLQFLQDSNDEIAFITFNCKQQRTISLFIEPFSIVHSQLFQQKVKIISMASHNCQIQKTPEFLYRFIYIEFVSCQSLHNISVSLITQGCMQHCLAQTIFSSEIYIHVKESTHKDWIIQSHSNLQRCLSVSCRQLEVHTRSADNNSKDFFIIVLNSDMDEPPSRFPINFINISFFLIKQSCQSVRRALLGQFDEIRQFAHNKQQMLYALIEYGILTVVCVYLVNYYASKEVSMHVKVWSVITWVLNFGLALLVPQDVYQTLKGQPDPGINHQLGLQYLLLYWLVYLLTWTIIPVLQEWQDAGDLESSARLKRSLRINGIFYLVLLAIAVVALIIMLILGIGKEMGLIIFLKCLATMWGMLLLMILLGYALVEIPKTLWRNAVPSNFLLYLYKQINSGQQEVEQAKREFKQVAAYIKYVRKNTTDPQILRYCDASEQLIPANLKSTIKSNLEKVITQTGYVQSYPISVESSIEHNRLMKRAICRCRRQQRGLSDYVKQAVFFQDVKEAIETGNQLHSFAKRTNDMQNWWYCKARTICNKILACFLGLCCLILLISENQVFLTKKSSILGYLLLFDNFQVIRILVFLVMGFIIYMSNYALFRLKLANLYGLYEKESDGASLMFATVNFSRVGVAIVLNFFDMVKLPNSIYGQVMQAPAMGLLGEWVLKGLPGVLCLIVLCHFFNVWGWMAKKLGVDDEYSFKSHDLSNEDEKQQNSPVLVVQKRRELEEKKSENLLQEMENF